MRSTIFTNGEFFHIYNRGVDKRSTFLDRDDYYRFKQSLQIFNTQTNFSELSFSKRLKYVIPKKNRLVDIHQFAFLPNHFHLLIRQKQDEGISRFLHKLGTSYTKYFNRKYKRSGCLFESSFKAKHVDNEQYLEHLTRYIHLNPLDLIEMNWKQGEFEKNTALDFLRLYEWSSYKNLHNDNDQGFLDLNLVKTLFPTINDLNHHLFEYQASNSTKVDFF